MEYTTQRLAYLANKRFSDILRDGFRLFIQSYGTLILPLAFFQVLLITLDIFLLTDFRLFINNLGATYTAIMDKFFENITLTDAEWNFLAYFLFLDIILLFLQNLIGATIITIAMCSVSAYVFKRFMKEDISLKESFKLAFNKKIFLVILIIGILLPLSSILLFVPAVIIFGFFIFLVFTFNMDGNKKPISEARSIAKGAFWKIIGVFIVNVLIIYIVSYFVNLLFNILLNTDSAIFISSFNSWHDPATRNYTMIFLFNLLISLVDIIFAPLFICLLTVLFSCLKAKRDLIKQHQIGYSPVTEIYREQYPKQQESKELIAPIPPEIKLEIQGRFYCPFCGVIIDSPKKFCPRCGENLSFIKE
ncbi:MAG: zinc ribbon domain-containing protein [Promethearchaeota archaeon]|nr:MAG: zinc ribbon domain-containing protein [Candidatus Lokiarchaeota archaeon]